MAQTRASTLCIYIFYLFAFSIIKKKRYVRPVPDAAAITGQQSIQIENGLAFNWNLVVCAGSNIRTGSASKRYTSCGPPHQLRRVNVGRQHGSNVG